MCTAHLPRWPCWTTSFYLARLTEAREAVLVLLLVSSFRKVAAHQDTSCAWSTLIMLSHRDTRSSWLNTILTNPVNVLSGESYALKMGLHRNTPS
jgi:hypothetical protein